jgi:hypothetical protein
LPVVDTDNLLPSDNNKLPVLPDAPSSSSPRNIAAITHVLPFSLRTFRTITPNDTLKYIRATLAEQARTEFSVFIIAHLSGIPTIFLKFLPNLPKNALSAATPAQSVLAAAPGEVVLVAASAEVVLAAAPDHAVLVVPVHGVFVVVPVHGVLVLVLLVLASFDPPF